MAIRGKRCVFGFESETAFTALDGDGHRVCQETALEEFFSLAREMLPNLSSYGSSGIFLANGARLYLDCCKPEIATPESHTPDDACRFLRACEGILADVARQLTARSACIRDILLTRCNVSYDGSGNTWGFHESYGYRRQSQSLPAQFIPHAVSRIVYSGAGGFDNRSAGIRFLVSPRVAHLRATASCDTQRERAIFNTKDESLCRRGFHRLHVICGENVSSLRSLWLRVATTALVVAMTEARMDPAGGLQLVDPLQAMQAFAHDTQLTAVAETAAGEKLTAVEIQRRLLKRAEDACGRRGIPPWADACCRQWRRILEQLERGPEAVERTLDWAMKLSLFRRHAERRGMPWDRLMQWHAALADHGRQHDLVPPDEESPFTFLPFRRRRPASPSPSSTEGLPSVLRQRDLPIEELELALQIRQELFELDTRFGQFDERGLFNRWERDGGLDHGVPGVEGFEEAKSTAPPGGRAQVRGRLVAQLSANGARASCDWHGVWHLDRRSYVDLSHPFESRENWQPCSDLDIVRQEAPQSRVREALRLGVVAYDCGDYRSAERWLGLARELLGHFANGPVADVMRFSAWTRARSGYEDGDRYLSIVHRRGATQLAVVNDFVCVYRYQGLVPSPQIQDWLERGQAILAGTASREPVDEATFLGHQAYCLLCEDRPQEALDKLKEALLPQRLAGVHARNRARMLTEMAAAERCLGRVSEANVLLDLAESLAGQGGFEGDLADFVWLCRSQLLADQERYSDARALLQRALATQTRLGSAIGEVRTLLLDVRLAARGSASDRETLAAAARQRIEYWCSQRPALAHCRRLSEILASWDDWAHGQPALECGGSAPLSFSFRSCV